MKTLHDYFSGERIILYLCKVRAKQAHARNKKHGIHILTGHDAHNYHINDSNTTSEFDKKLLSEINQLMPKRRQWIRLKKEDRYKKNNKNAHKQKLSSLEITTKTIFLTIKYFRKRNPNELFLINLDNFVNEIQNTVSDPSYTITPPKIYPKPKNLKSASSLKPGENNVCRPITLFHLKDRIIICFVNKFLTCVFDKYFESYSLAFRAAQDSNGVKKILSHHDAIESILTYKSAHATNPLWVAECDMKKFYDSVNHIVALNSFDRLAGLATIDTPSLDLRVARQIFIKYLDCYCFKTNVLCHNTNEAYWVEHRIASGAFDWIEAELTKLNYYNHGFSPSLSWRTLICLIKYLLSCLKKRPVFEQARIGVPQGGALSGLIANMVLDEVDKKLNISDDFLYIRFCDDMVIMHPNQKECKKKINTYQSLLKTLKLVPHKFESIKKLRKSDGSLAPFWEKKSKGPYKWDEARNHGFPWIGFVGYEVHCSGKEIRIRKSSLKKEIQKQKRIVEHIKESIEKGQRVTNGEVAKSVILRLIGMSVGRVELWNHKHVVNEMCWQVGFRMLRNTRHAIHQIKRLDKSRSKLYYDLLHHLRKKGKMSTKPKVRKNAQKIISYNRPFSYFHQVISRKTES